MSVLVVTPPQPVVDLATAKAHLRIFEDATDQDDYIQNCIDAAMSCVDGPEGDLGRCIGEQTLCITLDGFNQWSGWATREPGGGVAPWAEWGEPIRLPFGPIISIQSVTYHDAAGVQQTLDPAFYVLTASGRLKPSPMLSWPQAVSWPDSVSIQYVAGYATPPPRAIRAILMLVGHFFVNREAVVGVDARDSSAELPLGVQMLLGRLRVFC